MKNRTFSVIVVLGLYLGAGAYRAEAQQPRSDSGNSNHSADAIAAIELSKLIGPWRPVFSSKGLSGRASSSGLPFSVTPTASGPGLPVSGSGTVGRLPKWTGLTNSNSLIGDSTIFEDKIGKVGIGTSAPTSMLTVVGIIETTLGGYMFPDGSTQTTAGLTSILHDSTLVGNSTSLSPLGIAPSGVQTIHLANATVIGAKIANGVVVRSINSLSDTVMLQPGANITITPTGNTLTIAASAALTGVTHDTTVTGDGNAAAPLGVAVPLKLSSAASATVDVSNSSARGSAVNATAANIAVSASGGGAGVSGTGGFAGILGKGADGTNFLGGIGVHATGGNSSAGFGGDGVNATGGDSISDPGGNGVNATGGSSADAGGSSGHGIVAQGGIGVNGAVDGFAALLIGNVRIIAAFGGNGGDLNVAGSLNVLGGTKNFKIDHPLDPENKNLYHAAVESSEVLNIYSGNVRLDEKGEALVQMPEWFQAINRDFRYSLTAIGAPGPGLFIAQEITGNRFEIAGGAPGAKVSWQVTGIRSDAVMLKHPFKVEEDKRENERGYYLNPDVNDQPEERGIDWARNPQLMERLKDRREQIRQRAQPNHQ